MNLHAYKIPNRAMLLAFSSNSVQKSTHRYSYKKLCHIAWRYFNAIVGHICIRRIVDIFKFLFNLVLQVKICFVRFLQDVRFSIFACFSFQYLSLVEKATFSYTSFYVLHAYFYLRSVGRYIYFNAPLGQIVPLVITITNFFCEVSHVA